MRCQDAKTRHSGDTMRCNDDVTRTEAFPGLLLDVNLISVVQYQVHVLIKTLQRSKARNSKKIKAHAGINTPSGRQHKRLQTNLHPSGSATRTHQNASFNPQGSLFEQPNLDTGPLQDITRPSKDDATNKPTVRHSAICNRGIAKLAIPSQTHILQEPENQVDRLGHDLLKAGAHGEEFVWRVLKNSPTPKCRM